MVDRYIVRKNEDLSPAFGGNPRPKYPVELFDPRRAAQQTEDRAAARADPARRPVNEKEPGTGTGLAQ